MVTVGKMEAFASDITAPASSENDSTNDVILSRGYVSRWVLDQVEPDEQPTLQIVKGIKVLSETRAMYAPHSFVLPLLFSFLFVLACT